jgi:hypothetical protein
MACNDAYCIDCMKHLFKTALKDSSRLPLRCCAIFIDMHVSSMLLEKEETYVLELRLEERQTTSKMYCPTYSRFINLDLVDSSESTRLLCSCGTLLCTYIIENKADTTESDDILFWFSCTDRRNQCPGCKIMIALLMNCANYIHEFCFSCLRPWQDGRCSSDGCMSMLDRNPKRTPKAMYKTKSKSKTMPKPSPLLIPRLMPMLKRISKFISKLMTKP